jgi:WASH complex subunit strumpellin
LITLQIVSDLSYAWEIVDPAFTDEMQMGLKKDPSLVEKLRSTFLKVCFVEKMRADNVKNKKF